MSTLTSTTLPASLAIQGRIKAINSPNNKVVLHKNEDYLNKIVPQNKRVSFHIQAQQGGASIPSTQVIYPIVRPKFVLFGSSIVEYSFYEGWAATLAHLYARQVDIVLRGYAGWNSRTGLMILDRIFPKNAIQQPALVIVYFGGNDSILPEKDGHGSHVPLKEYSENMEKIFKHIESLSNQTRILFLSNPPMNEEQFYGYSPPEKRPRTNELLEMYSEEALKLCRKMNITAIDLWSKIQEHKDWKDYFIDGVHLNQKGSKVVTEEILNVLKDANWKPSLYWKRMPIEFIEYSDIPFGPDGKPLDPYNTRYPGAENWDLFENLKDAQFINLLPN